jgi:hypothetical protein
MGSVAKAHPLDTIADEGQGLDPPASAGHWRPTLGRTLRQAWVGGAFSCLGGVLGALLHWRFQYQVLDGFALREGAYAAGNLLAILASSMLAMMKFLLSIVVNALNLACLGSRPPEVCSRTSLISLAGKGARIVEVSPRLQEPLQVLTRIAPAHVGEPARRSSAFATDYPNFLLAFPPKRLRWTPPHGVWVPEWRCWVDRSVEEVSVG